MATRRRLLARTVNGQITAKYVPETKNTVPRIGGDSISLAFTVEFILVQHSTNPLRFSVLDMDVKSCLDFSFTPDVGF